MVAAAGGCALACLLGLGAPPARAIPAFARQYRLECLNCHTVVPQLNALGEQFRAAGYRLPPALQKVPPEQREADYQARLTPDLRLAERLFGRSPFALKLTGDLRYQSRERPRTRLFWDELLLNAGANHRRWSFYLHQHLHKGGRGAKEEYAAWVQADDLIHTKRHTASLQAGLFELELALSPHITRISSLGYLPYTATPGVPENFTLGEPELGLQLRGQIEPDWRYAVAVVTGSGLHRPPNGTGLRGVFVRAAHDLREGPTLGLSVYAGRRELRHDQQTYQNGLRRLGLDARWRPATGPDAASRLHLFGVLVWGTDDRLFIGERFRSARSFAGTLGADDELGPAVLLHGRLEWLQTNLPNGQQDHFRVVAGLHRLFQANFRMTLEGAFTNRHRQADEVQLFLGGLWAL
jgi:hypothetical protein